MKYSRIMQAFYGSAWAILPEKYEAIRALLELRASGGRVTEEEIKAITQAAARPSPRTAGNVAVIPVLGTLCYRAGMMSQYSGGASVQGLQKTFRQALSDDSVKAIVFDIDSPGGEVDGIQEFGEEIFNARGQKKMVAVSNTLAASGAYWLATAADELVVSPSAQVGSIGVFMQHCDWSKYNENLGVVPTYISAGKYKTDGNPDQPLSDDARANMQSLVDGYYNAFVNAVARGRGVPATDVKNGFGEGRVVLAKDAVKMGMADRVATLDQTLARFGVSSQVRQMAETEVPAIQAEAARADAGDDCGCDCQPCQDGDCTNCSNVDCDDPNCTSCPNQMAQEAAAPAGFKARMNMRRRQMQLAEIS